MDYLKNLDEPVERKIRYRASSYVILGDTLFKKSVDGNLLTCLSKSNTVVTLAEVHKEICGTHQAKEKNEVSTTTIASILADDG